MAENVSNPTDDGGKKAEEKREETAPAPPKASGGGWGFSPLSYLSDLQKAANFAAEEMSRNAAEVAKAAVNSIADMQDTYEESESSKEDGTNASAIEGEIESEDDNRCKDALCKLEKASEDTFLSQGLKVLDSSVENIASGAWQALGNALKGGSNLVHKLETSAVNFAETIQRDGLSGPVGTVTPSLLETGRAFTAKGTHVLEVVGKETMDLLITETGIEVEKNVKEAEEQVNRDQLYEEVTFDRCFYIYGGPEYLEELEALSNHYALLFNRKKAKMSSEQKSAYDGKLKQVQQIFNLAFQTDESAAESEKGKKVEIGSEGSIDDIKTLHDSSISKAAEMAAGFANALGGLSPNDIIQRTVGRLESLHSESVHRLSELCCFAVSQLLMLGKSIISSANKVQDLDADENMVNIDWPEDPVERAKIIRSKAQSMTGNVEAVSDSFMTGICDVAEGYVEGVKGATADVHGVSPHKSIQEKANAFSDNIHSDRITAASKIQDGMNYLTYVVLSTSMPSA